MKIQINQLIKSCELANRMLASNLRTLRIRDTGKRQVGPSGDSTGEFSATLSANKANGGHPLVTFSPAARWGAYQILEIVALGDELSAEQRQEIIETREKAQNEFLDYCAEKQQVDFELEEESRRLGKTNDAPPDAPKGLRSTEPDPSLKS